MFLGSKYLAAALLAFVTVPAIAQETSQADTNTRLRACGSITDPAARMDCFNAIVQSLAENSAADDAPAEPTAEPRPEPRPAASDATFGMGDLQAKEVAERRKKQPEFDTLHATIVEAWETIDGRFEVRLDNGQVWRETERTRAIRFPEAGTPVRITAGALGSYNMKFGSNNRLAGVRRTE